MVAVSPLLQRRLLSTSVTKTHHKPHQQWSIKQVTKSNFADTLEDIKSHVSNSDFVAVSLQNTGSFSAPWQRVSPFDTADTAYLKAKYAAERFQVLHFAVCPFTVRASKVTAYPYNFHLFPRAELKMEMPSYSFYCQTSSLISMARQGFDFNSCINDGISYLSREQESAAKIQMGNPILAKNVIESTSTLSVADSVFIERIKSHIKNWKKACKETSTRKEGNQIQDALVRSLRKLVLGNEEYDSRPCMNIDVCSERQAQLVVEMLQEFADDVVPLIIPAKGGAMQAIRVVLTSSKEDKDLLQGKLQNDERELKKKVRGFREVIDLISASQKPVVLHGSLNDLTVIHSKFIAPLPPTVDEFMCSLRLAFPLVIDVNHLMKEISPLRKVTSIPVAISQLKNRFFTPIDMEIPCQAMENEDTIHGQNVVKICELFARLCSILKIDPAAVKSDEEKGSSALEPYTNIFSPFCTASEEPIDGEIKIWTNNTRTVSCEDLVFLWGFGDRVTAGVLKSLLQESHEAFSKEFDVRLVDNSCAIVIFWQHGLSETFLNTMDKCSDMCGPLREMVSEGLRAAGYETYNRACRLGLWESSLADSLDRALADSDCASEANSKTKCSDRCNEWIINLDDL
ncbi:poly(A)-specific ribonuclease PARN-like [Populus nigra]|uniref:poly(A)-specific ribonuclease PARN-like n=1 Tax=Populus nigra TaxID=3691 RepID=UPI002B2725B6|nr:poly(A)-specific ribonuclease PARN-like [Populus nigra]